MLYTSDRAPLAGTPAEDGEGAGGIEPTPAAIQKAVDRTVDAESAAIQNGTPAWEAQDMFRDEWAFLPAEDDEPNLPPDRNKLTSGALSKMT